jgi:hypothetical protein
VTETLISTMSILLQIYRFHTKTTINLFKLSAFVIILSIITAHNVNVTATSTPSTTAAPPTTATKVATTTVAIYSNDTIIAARKDRIHHKYERMIESFDEYKVRRFNCSQ